MIEGYMFKYKGYLWVVKGCEHYDEQVIAFPRYDLINQTKIKDTCKALSIAVELGVVKYDECLKMNIPAVRRDEIEYVLNPFDRGKWPPLPREILGILEALSPSELEDVGLTGSYLASTVLSSIEPRDVDLIIRGKNTGFKVYRILKDLRDRGVAKPLQGIGEYEGTNLETRIKLLQNRVLEGVINDTVYSIRVVSCIESVKPTCLEKVELFNGELVIAEEVSPLVMPYTYIAVSSDLGRILIRSLRMRFSEIPVGTKLFVSNCRLEHDVNGSTYISLDNRECIVTLS
jgi:hypothetical protein